MLSSIISLRRASQPLSQHTTVLVLLAHVTAANNPIVSLKGPVWAVVGSLTRAGIVGLLESTSEPWWIPRSMCIDLMATWGKWSSIVSSTLTPHMQTGSNYTTLYAVYTISCIQRQRLRLKDPSRVLIPQEIPLCITDIAHDRAQPLLLTFPLLGHIFASQHDPQNTHHGDIRNQIAQRKPVAEEIPRRGFRAVQLRAEHGAQVPDGDLHGVGDAAFRLARDVIRWPGEDDGDGGVDACGGEEGS